MVPTRQSAPTAHAGACAYCVNAYLMWPEKHWFQRLWGYLKLATNPSTYAQKYVII